MNDITLMTQLNREYKKYIVVAFGLAMYIS